MKDEPEEDLTAKDAKGAKERTLATSALLFLFFALLASSSEAGGLNYPRFSQTTFLPAIK
jgi:hypothetical protein